MSALAAAPAAAEEAAGAASEAVVETTVDEVGETPAPGVTETPAPEVTETSAPEVTETPAQADDVAETAAPAPGPAAASAGDAVDAPSAAAVREAPAADAADASLLLVPPGDEVVDKVEICHATAAHNMPYVVNEPAADGDVSGHADHVGPIWFPGIEEVWGDIIPPFFYDDGDETPGFFPGLNWDAEGQVIYANDCEIPVEPDIDINVTDCVAYSDDAGILEVALSGLDADFDYRITVSDAGGVFDTVTISDTTGDAFEAWNNLPPGEYTVTVEWSIDGGAWVLLDSLSFTISVCPELGLTVTPGDCSTGDDGSVTVLFTGLIEGESYSYFIEGPDYFDSDSFMSLGESSELVVEDLPPGNFIVYIEWDGGEPVFDWAGFAIEPCQPEITVEVTECPAPGGTGKALVKLSSLVDGVEYDVAVTDRGAAEGTPYGGVHTVTGDEDGTAEVLVSSLPAGKDYTAWIDGLWEAPPWEEPPFVGGGGFVPLEWVALSARFDFSVKPCPAAVKPAALAATGADDVGSMLAGSMLLLGLGGALFAARRRMTGARDLS